MSAVLDTHTGRPDRGLARVSDLEQQIDVAYNRMRAKQMVGADSEDEFLEFARLVGQRCQTQILKLELERRLQQR